MVVTLLPVLNQQLLTQSEYDNDNASVIVSTIIQII